MRKLKNEELVRLSTQEFKNKSKIPLVIVLDNVRSMNNIGSVFRTSDAFLVNKIILCGITAQPPHNEINKTALGATESVDWEYFENTIDAINTLKELRYKVYAIEQAENSIELDDFKVSKDDKIAVIMGHEVRGVQQSVVDECDGCIEIEQYGTKHSLNVSVCSGIVIYQISRQFRIFSF